jgi:hypothetical protein
MNDQQMSDTEPLSTYLKIGALIVIVVAFGAFTACVLAWGHVVDVSSAPRPSSAEVPYWVWLQPASEGEWQIWNVNAQTGYRAPKESRCQMFHKNNRRLVSVYSADHMTVARYEMTWLERLFHRFEDECAHGTLVQLAPSSRTAWLHALAGWGI